MKLWQRVRRVVALAASSLVIASSLVFFSPQAANAAPVAWNFSAVSGNTAGGLVLNILGTGLANTTSVTFGGTAGTSIDSSDNLITVTTPAHSAGLVDVVITSGGFSTTVRNAFTYSAGLTALSPPSAVAAAAPTSSYTAGYGIAATFTAATNAKYTRAEVYNVATGAFVTASNTYGSGTTLYGMAPSTQYRITLYSVGDGVTYSTSAPISVTVTSASILALTAPPTATLGSAGVTSLIATIGAVEGTVSYRYFLMNSTGTTVLRTVDSGSTSFSFTGLTPNTSYTFKARAIGNGIVATDSVDSVVSAPLSTLAAGTTITAAAPTVSSVTADSAVVTVVASAPAAAAYRVFLYEADGTTLVSAQLAVATGSNSTFTGLLPNTTYNAKVVAIGDGINTLTSSASLATSFTTLSTSGALVVPTNVSVSGGFPYSASWTAASGGTSIVYFVYLYDGNGNVISRNQTTGTSSALAGIRPNTTYRVGVSAQALNYPETSITLGSPFTTAVDPSLTQLATPTASVAAQSASSITVSTTAVSGTSAYLYSIYASNQTTLVSQIQTTGTSTSFSDLAPGTTYYVSVTAIGDGYNYSSSLPATQVLAATSASASATTLSTPSGPGVTAGSNNVSVTYTATTLLTYISYTLKIYDGAGTTLLQTIPYYVSGTVINGLMPATTYKFTVTAIGDGVNYLSSAESAQTTAITRGAQKLWAPAPSFNTPGPTAVTVYFTAPGGYSSALLKLYDANQNLLMTVPNFSSGSSPTGTLMPNTTYYASMTFLGNGTTYLDSDESPKSSFTTSSAVKIIAPLPLLNSNAVTQSTAFFTFTAPSGSTSCRLTVYASDGVTVLTRVGNYLNGGALSGLLPSTSYYVSLKCFGNGLSYLDSDESSLVAFTTLSSMQLLPPTITGATALPAGLSVSFIASTSSLALYRVRVYDSTDTLLRTFVTTSASPVVIPGLRPSTTYKISMSTLTNTPIYLESIEGDKWTYTTPSTIQLFPGTISLNNASTNVVSVTITDQIIGFPHVVRLYKADGQTLIASQTLTSTAATFSTTFSNLASNTSYWVSVQALGNGTSYLNSVESQKYTFKTTTIFENVSPPVSAFTATSVTNSSIAFTFSSSGGYVYLGRLYASDGTTLLATYPGYTSGTVIGGLLPSTLYYFSLQSIGNGRNLASGRETIRLPVTTSAPIFLAPPSITGTVTPSSISLTFTAPTGTVSTTLRIYSQATGMLIATIPNYTTATAITNPITPGTAYKATVQSIGNGINSFTSEESAPLTLVTPPAITLSVPLITSTSTTPYTVTLAIPTLPSGAISTIARVYSADGSVLLGVYSGIVSNTAFGNFQPGTTYQVSVQAIGNSYSYLNSAESPKYTFRTQSAITLTAPVFSVYTLNGTSAGLNYTTITGAQSYTAKIYSADGQTLLAAVNTVNSQPIGGLSPNTTYQVSLTAVGNGSSYLTSLEGPKVAFTTPALSTSSPVVPNSAWVNRAGGISAEGTSNAVIVDSSNNVYVGGNFSLQATFGSDSNAVTLTSAGATDAFLAKYSANGTLLWVRQAGGTGGDYINSLAFDATGNLVVGGTLSGVATFGSGSGKQSLTGLGGADAFVAKYAADGTFAWVRLLAGTSDEFTRGVATDRAGNIFATGFFSENLIAGSGTSKVTLRTFGGTDGFLAKFASNGNLVWVKQFGGLNSDTSYGLTVDKDGNVFATGSAQAGAVFGSGSNAKEFLPQGQQDFYLAKYTNDGDFVWVQGGGGAAIDRGNSVATDAAGNIYAVGSHNGGTWGTGSDAVGVPSALSITSTVSQDGFIAKYSATGRLLWIRDFGGPLADELMAVAVDSSGNVYAGGNFSGWATISGGGQTQRVVSQGSNDGAVIKLNSEGTLVWARSQGSAAADSVNGLAVGSSGALAATGYFTYDQPSTGGSAIFSLGNQATALSSAGDADFFVSLFQTGADGTNTSLASPAPTASEIRSTGASFSFATQPGAASYTLKLWDSTGSTLLQTITNYMPGRLITGLSANTAYMVSLIAVGDGASTITSAESDKTAFSTTLTSPTPTIFNVGSDRASLSFPTVPGATSYAVNVYDSTGATKIFTYFTATPPSTRLENLRPNTTYKVAIKPFGDGLSNLNFTEGTPVTFTSAAATVLAAPVATQSFNTATTITVNIPSILVSPQMFSGTTGFLIRTYAADGVTLLGAFVSTSNTTIINGLTAATTYKVSVTALGDGIRYLDSAEGVRTLVSTTQASVAPAPTPIVTQITAGTLAVNFAPVPSLLGTSYVVKVNDFVFVGAASGSTFYTGILPNATNSVSIQSMGDGTNLYSSNFSTPVTYSAPAYTPAQLSAPSLGYSRLFSNSITLVPTPVVGAISYLANIYDAAGTSLLYTVPVVVAGTQFNYLLPNTTYKIEVIAIGNGVYNSNSNPSSMMTVTTPAGGRLATVNSITASSITATSFTVSFTGPSGPIGYVLKLYSADGQTLLASMPVVSSGSVIPLGYPGISSFKYSITALGDGVSFTDSLESPLQAIDLVPIRTLAAPLSSQLSVTPASVVLGFSLISGAASYLAKVYAADATTLLGIFPNVTIGTKITSPLQPGTTYYISLTAMGDGVNYISSSEGTRVAFTTSTAVKLIAPLPQVTITSARSLTIGWANVQLGFLATAVVRGDIYNADGTVRILSANGLGNGSSIAGLAPNTTYRISLTATGDNLNYLNSDPSPMVTFTTPGPITLAAPAPTVSYVSGSAFKLTFVPQTGSTSYCANIYASDGVTLVRRVTVTTGQAIFGLPSGVTYNIALVAVGDGSTYLTSPESAKTTFAFTGAGSGATLAAPTVTAGSTDTGSTRIYFTQQTGAISYTLKRYAADGTTLLATITNFVAGTLVTNLAPATAYKFSVTAIGDGTGYLTSAESSKLTVTTAAIVAPQLLPYASSVVTSSTANSSSITVTFPNSTGATKYAVKLYGSDGATLIASYSNFTSGTAITGLIPSTNYFVTVTAVGDGVNYLSSAESPQEAVTTSAAGALAAPTLSKLGQTSSSVALSFPAISGAVGYSVALYSADGLTLLGTFGSFASGDSVTGLNPNSSYQVRIRALANGINASNSALSSALTVVTGLGVPVLTADSVRPTSAAVTFGSVSGASSYTLKLYSSNGSTLLRTVTNYTSGTAISGLTSSTTYKISLMAIGDASATFNSDPSDLLTIVTPSPITLATPTPRASASTTTSVSVSFGAIADAISYTAVLYAANGSTVLSTITGYTSGQVISGLSSGASYFVSITAIGNGSTILSSTESTKVSLLTVNQTTLTAPLATIGSQTSSSAVVTFIDAADSLSTTLNLYAANGSTLLRTISGFASGSVVAGLSAGTTYKVKLIAIGDGNNFLSSSESDAVSLVTTSVITLTAPSVTVGSTTTNSFVPTFVAISGASAYLAKIYASNGTTLLRTVSPLTSGVAVTGLTSGTSYVVKFSAIGDGVAYLSSGDSTGVSVATTAQINLTAPTPSVIQASPTSLTFAFTANPDALTTRAKIYTGDGLTMISVISNAATGMRFTGLTPDTDYQIVLESIGDGVTTISSPESAQVAAHTAQPISLTAPTPVSSNVTSSGFTLSFNSTANAISYTANVYAADGVTLISSFSNLSPSGNSITGLNSSTTYKISMFAVGDEAIYLSSAEGTKISITTAQGVVTLDAPSASVDSAGATSALISFGSVANATSYSAKVYAADGTTVLQTLANFTSGSSISNLTLNTSYFISLKSNGDGNNFLSSAYGSLIPFATAPPTTLATPSITSASVTAGSVSLGFAGVDGAADYSVNVYAANGTTLLFTVSSYSPGAAITGLLAQTNYKFKVSANGDGFATVSSAYSSAYSATTSAPVQLDAPSPSLFSVVQQSAVIVFTPISGAVSYTARLYAANGTTLLRTITNFNSGSTISSLTAATVYQLTVTAIADGLTNTTSNASTPLQIETPSVQVLSAPSVFVSGQTPHTITLSFGAVTGATSYTATLYAANGTTLLTSIDGFNSGDSFINLATNTVYQVAVLAHGDGTNNLDSSLGSLILTGTTAVPALFVPDTIASATGTTTATASFSAQGNAVSFQLRVYAADGTTLIRTINNFTSGSTIGSLSPSTTYGISVRAIGDTTNYVNSDFSSPAFITTDAPVVLTAPSASATGTGFNSISVTSGTVANASGYTAKLYSAGGTLLRTITSWTSGTTISGLTAGTTYEVAVIALGDNTNYLDSPESTRASVTTTAAVQLSAPTISISGASRSGFQFSFGAISHAVSYNATLYAANGTTVVQSWTNLSGTTTVTGLSANTTYKLSMTTIGDSNYTSSAASPLTTVQTLNLDALQTPGPGTSSATFDSVAVTFTAISHSVSYTARLYAADGTTLLRTITNFASGSTISGLSNGTTYKLSVTAIADGASYLDSAESSLVSFSTWAPIQLAAPTPSVSSVTRTGFQFSFGTINHAVSYNATLFAANGTTVVRSWTGISGTTSVSNLTLNTVYKLSLTAIGDTNYLTSNAGALTTVTTLNLDALTTPSITNSNLTMDAVDVSFSNVANSTSYTLNIYNGSGSLLRSITSFNSGDTVTGLTAGTAYRIGLVALADGVSYLDSAESNRISFTTIGAPVSAPAASPQPIDPIALSIPKADLVSQGRTVILDLKKLLPNADFGSVSAALSQANGDLSSVSIVNGVLQVKPRNYFSGTTRVKLLIVNAGERIQVDSLMEFKPAAVTATSVNAWSLSRSTVRWAPTANASYYRVTVNGKTVCETLAESCAIDSVVGPKSTILVTPFSSDAVAGASTRVTLKIAQPLIAGTVWLGSAVLNAGEKSALASIASTARTAGFTKVVLVKPAGVSGTAKAKMLAAQTYLTNLLGKSIQVTSKFSNLASGMDIKLG